MPPLPPIAVLLAAIAVMLPLLRIEGRIRLGWRWVIAAVTALLLLASVTLWIAYEQSKAV